MAVMPVVVGVDGSEESLRAVEWAALEAQRHRAPLRIVSVPALPPRMRACNGVQQTVADQCPANPRARCARPSRGRGSRARPLIDAGLLTGRPRSRSPRAAPERSCSSWVPAVPGGSRNAARLGQQVRGHARPLPGRSWSGRRRARCTVRSSSASATRGRHGDPGLRVRRGRTARRDPGRRPLLELVSPRYDHRRRGAAGHSPTPSTSRRRRTRTWPRPWSHGGASTPACPSAGRGARPPRPGARRLRGPR